MIILTCTNNPRVFPATFSLTSTLVKEFLLRISYFFNPVCVPTITNNSFSSNT